MVTIAFKSNNGSTYSCLIYYLIGDILHSNIPSNNNNPQWLVLSVNHDLPRLLVIKPEGEEYYKKLNVVINDNMDCIDYCQSPPTNPYGSEVVHLDDKFRLRLCKLHLWQDFSGYGFNVQGLEGKWW